MMQLIEIQDLLDKIKGCTFASIDCRTSPADGLTKVTTNERVMLFTNQGGSAYEKLVHRRLLSIGKDPSSFRVGDLPWGKRITGTPLIIHEASGRLYLQAIILEPGEAKYFLGARPTNRPSWMRPDNARDYQGLPEDKAVHVRCYALDNITGIRLMGRKVLSING